MAPVMEHKYFFKEGKNINLNKTHRPSGECNSCNKAQYGRAGEIAPKKALRTKPMVGRALQSGVVEARR